MSSGPAWEDGQVVDVDFRPIIDDPDDPRMGGCDPRTDALGEHHGLFGSAFETIPRSQWEPQEREQSAEALCPDDEWSQGSEGSCTAFNTAMNFQTCWARTFGKSKRILVSPQSTFKLCASSPRGGSSVSCNMRYAREKGYCLMDTPEMRDFLRDNGLNDRHVMPAIGYRTRFPQDWEQSALNFRLKETWDLSNYDEFVTALLLGFTVSYGRAGHSICATRYIQYKGRPANRYRNSWTNQWGDNGYGVDTERAVAAELRRYGAIAARTCYVPSLPFATAG